MVAAPLATPTHRCYDGGHDPGADRSRRWRCVQMPLAERLSAWARSCDRPLVILVDAGRQWLQTVHRHNHWRHPVDVSLRRRDLLDRGAEQRSTLTGHMLRRSRTGKRLRRSNVESRLGAQLSRRTEAL